MVLKVGRGMQEECCDGMLVTSTSPYIYIYEECGERKN
jgi:hypothetical protein